MFEGELSFTPEAQRKVSAMKTVLAAAIALVVSVSASAASSNTDANSYDPTTSQVQNLENGPIYAPKTLEEKSYSLKLSGIGDILKRIAGDVIRAELLDREYGRDGYRRQITCYAQNGRGEVFRASGNRPQQVQARAIDKCYAYSRNCRPVGCDRGGRR